LKFRKSGVFYQKSGVYQEIFFHKSGEKSGDFSLEAREILGGFSRRIRIFDHISAFSSSISS